MVSYYEKKPSTHTLIRNYCVLKRVEFSPDLLLNRSSWRWIQLRRWTKAEVSSREVSSILSLGKACGCCWRWRFRSNLTYCEAGRWQNLREHGPSAKKRSALMREKQPTMKGLEKLGNGVVSLIWAMLIWKRSDVTDPKSFPAAPSRSLSLVNMAVDIFPTTWWH